jgi:hypothetical protein
MAVLVVGLFVSFMGMLFGGVIAFEVGLFGVGLVLAGGLLLGLVLPASFLLVALHHLFELAVLAELLLLFLFAVSLSLVALLVCTASGPGLCVSFLILEDGFIIDVFESGDGGDEGFTVVGDFFIELVVLDVEDCEMGEFGEDFGEDGFGGEGVVGVVEC